MHLKYVVIQLLQEKPYSGYGLMKAIYENSGWKPSPGSMYPVLDGLTKEKLIIAKSEGKKKIYTLSNDGKKYSKELMNKTGKMVDEMMRNVKLFERLYMHGNGGLNDALMAAFEELKKGKLPLGNLTKDMIELKKILLKIYLDKRHIKNEKKIKMILNRTIRELRAV